MTAKKTRLDEIQKLRAFALVFCCMGHFPFAVNRLLIHGYTGVTIFFVISGYVCTRSFLKTFEQYSDSLKKPSSYIYIYILRQSSGLAAFSASSP